MTMLSSSSSPSELRLSVVPCSTREYCCEYCELDHVETTSHAEHCIHPPDSPSLHFVLYDASSSSLYDIHPACLNPELVYTLLPLAHCDDILNFSSLPPVAQALIRRLIFRKLADFYVERDASLSATFNRQPEAFSDRLVDKFTCGVCHHVLYRPVEVGCGHLLCDGCWVNCMRYSGRAMTGYCACPICRKEVNIDRVHSSPALQLLIEGLEVHCVNHNEGCDEWITVGKDERNLRSHLLQCPLHPIACPDCGLLMPRKNLKSHSLDCQFFCTSCHRLVPCRLRKQHREGSGTLDLCVDARRCPNGCDKTKSFHHSDLPLHLLDCPLESVQCEICDCQYLRQEEAEHMQSSIVQHINLQQKIINSQREEMERLKEQVDGEKENQKRSALDIMEHSRLKRRRSTSIL